MPRPPSFEVQIVQILVKILRTLTSASNSGFIIIIIIIIIISLQKN